MIDDSALQRPLEAWGDGGGYGVLAVTGAEAHGFLQRIVTADIPPPGSPQTTLAGLCTPQGRLAALASLRQEAVAARLGVEGSELAGVEPVLEG